MWHVYIIQSDADYSLYVGTALNPHERLKQHNSSSKGAKRTRGRGPWQLRAMKAVGSRSDALRVEYTLKRGTRDQKLLWLAQNKLPSP